MSSPNKFTKDAAVFPVGPAGKRELRRALLRSTDPAGTIQHFQKDHSLHSMMAKAFKTTPSHEIRKTRSHELQTEEPLDTDSVMIFLSHLGVRQHEVHKRISDTLMKQLEGEIRKSSSQDALLELLKSCWTYATTMLELRPVLWAVLKTLGERTPIAVLDALAERDDDGKLKHADIFIPLPPLLKRLCWEADWESRTATNKDKNGGIQEFKLTLLYETLEPLMTQYCTNTILVDAADRLYVGTTRERRVLTKQRRALTSSASNTITTSVPSILAGAKGALTPEQVLESGKVISQIRGLLCDTTGSALTFRPKLVYALFSILIAQHGATDKNYLGSSKNLRCSLVADILLSAGGTLPKPYTSVAQLAQILDDCVQEGNLTDQVISSIQKTLREIYQLDDEESLSQQTKATVQKEEIMTTTTSMKRQLNKIISAGLAAMKEADLQSLFLNPVTDAIAPGYSKVIKKPVSVVEMEHKVLTNKYETVDDWEKDVKLMYKNCIDYNRGSPGEWFRGEAQRQGKVFRDEIYPQARRLYQAEVAKRGYIEDTDSRKRKATDGSEIAPLPALTKKRKIETKDENSPSMPALASMLLADPVRSERNFCRQVLEVLTHKVTISYTLCPVCRQNHSCASFARVATWSNERHITSGCSPDNSVAPSATVYCSMERPNLRRKRKKVFCS
jgi:hypothetical protein